MEEPHEKTLSPYNYIEFNGSGASAGMLSSQPQRLLIISEMPKPTETTEEKKAREKAEAEARDAGNGDDTTPPTLPVIDNESLAGAKNKKPKKPKSIINESADESPVIPKVVPAFNDLSRDKTDDELLSLFGKASEGMKAAKAARVAYKNVSMSVLFVDNSTKETLKESLAKLPEQQYTQIVYPYTEAEKIKQVVAILDERWKSDTQIDGHLFVPLTAEQTTKDILSKHVTVVPGDASWAGAFAAVNAQYAVAPSRPYQTLKVPGLSQTGEAPKLNERNTLLNSGISTYRVKGTDVHIDRLVTTDTSLTYRDLNVKQTLSYLRYDFKRFLDEAFPRHMLARDNAEYEGPVVTPKAAKAMAIARYRKWQGSNLVQDPGGKFADGVRVEVDPKDTGKLLFLLPVIPMGQLRVTHTQIAFSF